MRTFTRAVSLVAFAAMPLAAQAPAAAKCAPARKLSLDDPLPSLAMFDYDRSAPLDVRDSVERVEAGATLHRISFASPKGGRATGFIIVPADSLRGANERFAGMVLLHGAAGDATGMLTPALSIA